MFQVLLPIINAIMFPGSRSCCCSGVRLRQDDGNSKIDTSPPTAERRRKALQVPLESALIGVGSWVVAGVLWPIVLSRFVPLTAGDYLQFVSSLVMCGIMSAVHTFFVTAVFAVRVLLPVLWRKPESADRKTLRSFDRRLNVFLALGFAVPFMGIALISIFQAQTPAGLLAMRWLSAAGLFGALFTLALDRWLRYDTETLQSAVERE